MASKKQILEESMNWILGVYEGVPRDGSLRKVLIERYTKEELALFRTELEVAGVSEIFEYIVEGDLEKDDIPILADPVEDLPLHVNNDTTLNKAILNWRLKVGK